MPPPVVLCLLVNHAQLQYTEKVNCSFDSLASSLAASVFAVGELSRRKTKVLLPERLLLPLSIFLSGVYLFIFASLSATLHNQSLYTWNKGAKNRALKAPLETENRVSTTGGRHSHGSTLLEKERHSLSTIRTPCRGWVELKTALPSLDVLLPLHTILP